MNRRFTLLPVAVAAVGLLVAGCSGSSTASSAPAAQPAATSAPAAQPTAAPQSTGTAGQGESGQAGGNAAAPRIAVTRVFGSVDSVSGDTMTVKTQQGSTSVKVTGARIQKTVDGTAADLTAGESVVVAGKQGSDGSFTATNIQIRAANAAGASGFQGPGRGQAPRQGQAGQAPQQGRAPQQGQGVRPVVGSVVSLSGDTLTVKDSQGKSTSINITGARIEKTVDGTAADLKAGENVAVVGQKGSDGTVTAGNIDIMPAGVAGGPARGGAPQANPSATPAGN